MNEQEYKHIRNLAWDLLIDANITQLPVNIDAIASLYGLQSIVDNSKPLFENALAVSENILRLFGIQNRDLVKYLTVRVLAPLTVLKELGVGSAEELSRLSGLPTDLAQQRLSRLNVLIKRGAFNTSNLEKAVLAQFRDWIARTK